jgi:hypothetical protein
MIEVLNLTKLTAHEEKPLALFVVTSLGNIDSLVAGSITPTEAIRVFFHAKNCLYVRRKLRNKQEDEVMGRGVQLADLFDVLPMEEAHREFQHELQAMKTICHDLLQAERLAA